MSISLKELAEHIGAEFDSAQCSVGDLKISGINSPRDATSSEITFISSSAHLQDLTNTRAAAVILSKDFVKHSPVPVLLHGQPYIAYALMSVLFTPAATKPSISSTAVVSESAVLGRGVNIGPNAVVGDDVSIGDKARIGPNVSIGNNCMIGQGTIIHANVSIYHGVRIGDDCILHSGSVIGSDGFGFAPSTDGWVKIHQLGTVEIGSRVEIGSNSTIDRGAIENTIIADGVKIDNLTHIAHNVKIGENTAFAAQSGIAGSTKIGKNCVFGGQSGVVGHIEIVDGVTITAKGMVTKSIKDAGVYSSGTSFSEMGRWRKNVVRFQQLDAIFKRLVKLEKEFKKK